MILELAALALAGSSAASAVATSTDFGERVVPGAASPMSLPVSAPIPIAAAPAASLSAAASLGAQWGTVTSTKRTAARNRAVGGVANSYHLSGRAIDIARRPGVRHADIAAAYRRAGYHLIESLDEGDHSHFAFAPRFIAPRPAVQTANKGSPTTPPPTQWRIVTAPKMASR